MGGVTTDVKEAALLRELLTPRSLSYMPAFTSYKPTDATLG
jgi:hypothetical protein